jgi:dihydroorotate dehydrogenase
MIRLLLELPPEWAHHIVVFLLKIYQAFWFKGLKKKIEGPEIIVSSISSLKFKSRIGLAAGFDKNAEVFSALASFGFGFIEVGTVTPLPQAGNAKPRIWRVKNESLVNAMGFNNVGLNQFKENIVKYRSYLKDYPLWVNIGKGKDTPLENAIEDYRKGFEALKDVASGFVVNVSSPNTKDLRSLQTDSFLEKIQSIAPELPVLIKLAPDLENNDIQNLCEQVNRSSQISGVVLTNTSRKLASVYSEVGGFSGPDLFERSLECVSVAREKLSDKKLLIGVGGITSVERAQKMRNAGADLLEIYTGFIYQGPSLVKKLTAVF